MYKRFIVQELAELVENYPVVTIIGPRQSGKTTLVQNQFPHLPYVNLEAKDVRDFATYDPRGFFEKYPNGAILDEIQRAPELLSYIQIIVDEKQQNGMFVLTGSHQMELRQAIAQSLAGRTATLTLLPMSLAELKENRIHLSLDEALLLGGYPRIFKEQLDPTRAYSNYFQTYIERDLRQLSNIKDLMQFQRFMKICAGRIGQLINLEGIAGDVGISTKTVKEWLSILEASFVLIRVQPYFENFGKRITKSSKLYFTDVGLASYLLGIENLDQLPRDPLRGNLVENLIFLELYKSRINQGLDSHLYFFRDAHGNEVDFIHQKGRELIPIEVKAGKTFHIDFLKNLDFFRNIAGERCKEGFLIYGGEEEHTMGLSHVINYAHAGKALVEF
ncbi:MAG: ATP-binding protein [Simkaniaceae bacterium]|nr:ATP-binding protein [Candidatus Sacchlamyda saccharinae]